MERPGDPLGFLGLGPDADARAVKRAYAARLKQTRPEDDAEGFARLVAARDAALRLIRGRDEAAEAAAAFRYRPIDVAALARLAAAFPTPAEADGETVVAADDTAAPDAVPSPSLAPSLAPSPSPSPSPAPVGRPVAGAAERPPALGVAEIVAAAEALLAGPTPDDADGWAVVFERADALPLALRGAFEHKMAEGVNAILPWLTAPGGLGEARTVALVSRIGEEFGWLGATRRVAGFFWPPDGRQPLPSLLERILSRVPAPGRDENGVPILDPFDLDSFFGGPEHRSARLYARGRRRGRLGWGWNPTAFVSPVGWMALEGWYSAAAVALAVGVVAAPLLPQPGDDLAATPALIGYAVLAVAHVAAALAADRLSLARLIWHRPGADRASPYRDAARRRHLAGKTQRARGIVVAAALIAFLIVDLGPATALIEALSDLWQAAP